MTETQVTKTHNRDRYETDVTYETDVIETDVTERCDR